MLSWASSMAQAEEAYYIANGQYTGNPTQLDLEMPSNCVVTSDYESAFACGKYFQFTLDPDGSVNINYCPDNNTTESACIANREIHIAFRLAHFSAAPSQAGKRICSAEGSALGRSVCASIGLKN